MQQAVDHAPVSSAIHKKPPSLTKSCVACRTSKVKCEASEEEGGLCRRCDRLGLHCIFEESKRGRPCRNRNVARLGPSVRALLRTTVPLPSSEAPAETGSAHLKSQMEETRGAPDDCNLAWVGNQCQRKMVTAISAREGQIALLKHWLLIGVRSGSCGLLGNVLILAHSCNITLHDFSLQIDRSLPPSAMPHPPYIQEWLDEPGRLCCARRQVEGAVSWLPNQGFISSIGDEATLRVRLEAQHVDISSQVDYLICTAEIFLAIALHQEDQSELAKLNGALWSSLAPAPDGTHVGEATAPSWVRCLLQSRNGKESAYTPCLLSGRTVVHRDSRAVFSAFSLTPCPPSSDPPPSPPGDVEERSGSSASSDPSGTPAWPMQELQNAMMTIDGEGLSYDFLDDLGLQLEPSDADLFDPLEGLAGVTEGGAQGLLDGQ
jgi:hypothetical protein